MIGAIGGFLEAQALGLHYQDLMVRVVRGWLVSPQCDYKVPEDLAPIPALNRIVSLARFRYQKKVRSFRST